MQQTTFSLTIAVCLAQVLLALHPVHAEGPRVIDSETLSDKIRGGWAGKMIGVAYGAPTEFAARGEIYEQPIEWSPELVRGALHQDDLYVGMTLAETMDRLGPDATVEQYGEAFRDTQYHLWHANAGARRLLNLGIDAPWSGHPKFNIHANDIDFQIEADFIGLMCPGLPQQSNYFCDRIGRVMNYGDGLYGGMFVAGMYTAAYFEDDPKAIVAAGRSCLPDESQYAQLLDDVMRWHEDEPDDWRAVWRRVVDRWDRHDCCPDGALSPFNIDAKLNGGFVALGLLYGRGDFARTLEISTRAGQDSDCNPSTAAGVLGVVLGYEGIPHEWRAGIPTVADEKFAFTNSSLNDICDSTARRARLVVQRAGGRVEESELFIPRQDPSPAALEQWSMGIPDRMISIDDPAFDWSGPWRDDRNSKAADEAGARVELRFKGTAVALVGACHENGGRADVLLDGKPVPSIDAYASRKTHDNDLWHGYGFSPGEHVLTITVRGEADPRAGGAQIAIERAIVYREEDDAAARAPR